MGGEPGDRQLGLPGPLVGYMPQSIRQARRFFVVGYVLDLLVGYMPQSIRRDQCFVYFFVCLFVFEISRDILDRWLDI